MPNKRAVAYIRVSTESQSQSGLSLEAQEEKVRAMAKVLDIDELEVVVDAGASAKSLIRPGIQGVLQDLSAIDVLIVAKLDRLTRSVADLGRLLDLLERNGVSLVSVGESLDTGTASGRLVLNIMASVSQWEREAIGERTRDALQAKKARGERVGTVPYGFKLDGPQVVPCDAERGVLGNIAAMSQQGLPLRTIAARLNDQGLRTRRGRPWSVSGVWHLRQLAEQEQNTLVAVR
jgi:DNA invertase Pin-like site-specific DNA recombinase